MFEARSCLRFPKWLILFILATWFVVWYVADFRWTSLLNINKYPTVGLHLTESTTVMTDPHSKLVSRTVLVRPHSKLLTLFTTLTNKQQRVAVERNVLRNWALFGDEFHLVVFTGDCNELCNLTRSLPWHMYPIPRQNQYGAPYLLEMFQRVMNNFNSDFYGYANADILLTPNLTSTLHAILDIYATKLSTPLLLVARRTDVHLKETAVPELFQFKDILSHPSILKPSIYVWGYDIFISRNIEWSFFPDFVVSRPYFDIYIPILAALGNITIIDMTATVVLFHQKGQSLWLFESQKSPANLFNRRLFFNITGNAGILTDKGTCTTVKEVMRFTAHGNSKLQLVRKSPLGCNPITQHLHACCRS